MKPLFALTALLTITAPLAACAGLGPGQGITGNDTGGIIPYPLVASQADGSRNADRAVARSMADGHCARYDKRAVNVTLRRQYGEYVAFDCSWR
jgi:hypothetical protein